LQARKERLEYELKLYGEQKPEGELVFSKELIEAASDSPTTQMLMESEKARFISRMAALRSSQGVLQQTLDGYQVEILGLRNELAAVQAQLDILNKQNQLYAGLRQKGLEVESKVLESLRSVAQSEQLKAERTSRIDQLKESIKTATLQKNDMWISKIDEATSELASVSEDILTGKNTIATYRDTVQRTVIKAPVKGTLISLKINTVGAVVQPGATVVEIVPADEALMLEVHIDTTDIDVVKVGQHAVVTLLAYPQRELPKLNSTLESVSADAIVDSKTGSTYYVGKMRITEEELKRLGDNVGLVPGMPVQAMIQTSTRTFVEYLLSPILDSADLAFRE
jgi:HlyD family type I secretion membrane fusion protein